MAFCLIFFVLVFGLIFNFFSREGFAPPPSRVAPTVASQGGGGGPEGAKMALGLACGQGWWRSCSAAAIFPRGGRRPVCREAGREPEPRSPRGPQGAVDGARAAIATPDPKAGSLGWAQRGGGALLSIFCLRPKTVGCGRLPGCTGSVPDALQPAGFFSFDLGLNGLVFQAPAEGRVLRPLTLSPGLLGLGSQFIKPTTGPVCLPCSSWTLRFIRLCLVGCIVKQSGEYLVQIVGT